MSCEAVTSPAPFITTFQSRRAPCDNDSVSPPTALRGLVSPRSGIWQLRKPSQWTRVYVRFHRGRMRRRPEASILAIHISITRHELFNACKITVARGVVKFYTTIFL
ncbi:hypothetical protein I41_23790 [Lacipirellula limnantheis]|uniref:Uncharacterized protein n=1 Tax=Lacipirellula limnantheis TaxID=2528024 RepID=A0A517TXU3_9BACT|nr:hypothetical protein I41_23790 [Lacipirellula limnantheis]